MGGRAEAFLTTLVCVPWASTPSLACRGVFAIVPVAGSLQRTQSWLERYVYKRAPRSYNMNLTYFISAFWHGFYPGCVVCVFVTPGMRGCNVQPPFYFSTCIPPHSSHAVFAAGFKSTGLPSATMVMVWCVPLTRATPHPHHHHDHCCPPPCRYYLFFLSVPLLQNLSKAITVNVRPYTFQVP